MIFGIIVAGGKSERMGATVDKAFLSLGTQPVLAYSLQAYEKCQDIDGIVLVVRKDRLEAARGMVQLFGCAKVTRVVADNLHVEKLTILDGGNGDGLPTHVKSLTNSAIVLLEQMKNATGVDFAKLAGKQGQVKGTGVPKELD